MQVNALISNPNLGPETDPETILEGHRLVLEAAHQLKLPVAFLGVRRNLADRLKKPGSAVISARSDVEAALAGRLSRLDFLPAGYRPN